MRGVSRHPGERRRFKPAHCRPEPPLHSENTAGVKSKARGTNPWMSDILAPLEPDDLEALAALMAGR